MNTRRILHVETLLALAAHDGDGYDMLDLFGTENALQDELAALAHEYAELAAHYAALEDAVETAASLIQGSLGRLEYGTQLSDEQVLMVRHIRRVLRGLGHE